MRSGQQNKRGRGRNNNNNNNGNRKGSNPLTRTYDSSGPDVKIRGTAQHIAEKYAQLARDAQGAGDRVMAENYLQHAEHYNRIIATAQAQMQERFQRDEQRNDNNRDDLEDGDANGADKNEALANDQDEPNDGSGPQPVIDETPAEVSIEDEAGAAQASSRRRQPRQRRPRRTNSEANEAAAEGAAPEGAAEAASAPPMVEVAE